MEKKTAGFCVIIEEYTPDLTEADVSDLGNFIVELLCTQKDSEVHNG